MIEFNRRGYNKTFNVYESYYMAQMAITRKEDTENYKEGGFIEYEGKIYEIEFNNIIKKTTINEQEVYEIIKYRKFNVAAN